MNPARHHHFIRAAIKNLMRERKLRYADLGSALGLSIPTVKRLMSRDSIPLSRLTAICEWLEIEFYDLIAIAKSLQDQELQFLTPEQEAFLVRSPQACRFLIEIMNFRTPAQIAQKFGLNQKSVDLYLTDLRKAGLISRKGINAVQVVPELLRGPRPKGPLLRDLAARYQRIVPPLIERELGKQVQELEQVRDNVSETIGVNGFNLTRETQSDLLREVKALREKFAEIERIQAQTVPHEKLVPVTFVTLLTEGSIYAKAYGDIKNRV